MRPGPGLVPGAIDVLGDDYNWWTWADDTFVELPVAA